MRLLVIGFIGSIAWAQTAPKFGSGLYPVLETAGCRNCHSSEGVASTTRLQFPEEGADAGEIDAFGKSLVRWVDSAKPDASLILTKPTARVGHAGGERILKGSEGEKILRAWVGQLAVLPEAERTRAMAYKPGAGGEIPRVAVRRLTHSQYNNVVRDLAGDQSLPANQFPPEDYVNGFKNQYKSQNLSPLLMEAYSAAAEKIARTAFRAGDSRGLIPCKTRDAACRSAFIARFGARAFRRPLEPAEQKRYDALFVRQADFLKGAQAVVEAMLQSPHFLFRLEETSKPEWKPYVTASRMAFALWDSMPDDDLFAAAKSGALSTPEGVEKAARRMLGDPRAKQALDEFVAQWMRFDRVLTTVRERRRYPKFSREAAVAMTEETRRFVADLTWNDRNFMELFTADHGYVNADLAAIYEVAAPARQFEPVPFPADAGRAGLLGQATFLTLTAKPDDTSPTARGLFVREQFLCQHVPPPPPGVDTNLPPVSEGKPMTNKERLQAHLSNQSCAGCHTLVDPIGFGFEKFDAIGGRREKAKLQFRSKGDDEERAKTQTIELPLDTRGFIAGVANSAFESPKQLGEVLARTPRCQECLVKQYFRYTAGRLETPADRPLIERATADFRRSQFRFKELMISVVRNREAVNPGGEAHVARDHQAR